MTTQVPAPPGSFPWAAGLQSRLASRPLAPRQRQLLERSLQAQSLTAAVLSLTSSVGYAAMPCFKGTGHLRVHPEAGIVTTPGGFRVSFRDGQVRLQSPDGLWTELEAEPLPRPMTWRHPLTARHFHVLLPDGTRLTLQRHEARLLHRVVVSHGNEHLAADRALSGPVWQPVRRNGPSALFEVQQEGTRYEAMIDDGLSRHRVKFPWKARAMNRLVASAALFLDGYAAAPEHWDQLQETFRARQSQPHLPVTGALGNRERLQTLWGGPAGAVALWGHDIPFDLPSRFAQMRNAVSELLLLLLKPGTPSTGEPLHEPDDDRATAPAGPSRGDSVSGCADARLPPGRSSARGPLRIVP